MTTKENGLPSHLKPHFWDCDFAALSWDVYRDFIIRRILQHGSWDAVQWLRRELGDPALGQWILQQRGAGLSPRQLRFWEVALDLPRRDVTRWVKAAAASPWERRAGR